MRTHRSPAEDSAIGDPAGGRTRTPLVVSLEDWVLNTTSEKLVSIFTEVFELPEGASVPDVRQAAEPRWDSLAHVILVGAIESEFGLQIDAADSLTLTSYNAIAVYLEGRGL